MRCRALFVACALGACGGDEGETGVCRDRPCLTTIADDGDWRAISVPHDRASDGRCDLVEESKFLAPATATAPLQDVVFQDAGVHALHLDFMTQVLPELFGGLSITGYRDLVQRRATRQYWAGALYRIVDADGATEGHGFEVVTALGPGEQITGDEIAAVYALLTPRFRLPLVYAPTQFRTVFGASGLDTPTHLPRSCAQVACPGGAARCVVVPATLDICTLFSEGRSLEAELAAKLRLTVPMQTVVLPPGAGPAGVPALVSGGASGANAEPVVVATAARYQDSAIVQALTVGGEPRVARIGAPGVDVTGGYLIDAFTGASVVAQVGPVGSPTAELLGACRWPYSEHWQVRGELGGGDRFTIDLAYRPRFFGSSPLSVQRAEVTLGGTTVVVDDYFRLVYAGQHHNLDNQLWIRFAAPLDYRGHPVDGLWLDQRDADWGLEALHTVDAARLPLDELAVTGYVVEQVP